MLLYKAHLDPPRLDLALVSCAALLPPTQPFLQSAEGREDAPSLAIRWAPRCSSKCSRSLVILNESYRNGQCGGTEAYSDEIEHFR